MTTPRKPQRIQLSRQRGWRKPEGAVVVSRPSKWGNPFALVDCVYEHPADALRRYLSARRDPWPGWVDLLAYPSDAEIRDELRGKDLACWCPLDAACHADVLLELANPPTAELVDLASGDGR